MSAGGGGGERGGGGEGENCIFWRRGRQVGGKGGGCVVGSVGGWEGTSAQRRCGECGWWAVRAHCGRSAGSGVGERGGGGGGGGGVGAVKAGGRAGAAIEHHLSLGGEEGMWAGGGAVGVVGTLLWAATAVKAQNQTKHEGAPPNADPEDVGGYTRTRPCMHIHMQTYLDACV